MASWADEHKVIAGILIVAVAIVALAGYATLKSSGSTGSGSVDTEGYQLGYDTARRMDDGFAEPGQIANVCNGMISAADAAGYADSEELGDDFKRSYRSGCEDGAYGR